MNRKYKGFLIDLDGTVYLGNKKIKEAVDFVKALERKKLDYLFVTNKSSTRPEAIAKVLQGMGIPATTEHVLTSSMATAAYVTRRKENARIYVIGEGGLYSALREEGHQIVEKDVEFVVMGFDREITYEKLAKATLNIQNGAEFIATNGDVALPTDQGVLPGCGSLVSAVTVSTGVEPIFIGKPESIIIEQALAVLGTEKEETLIIGDNYDTDILSGLHAGIDSLIVYTGLTTREQIAKKAKQPTYEVNSLIEFVV